MLIVHPGPSFSVSDVYAGWNEALRGLGLNVQSYNLGDLLTFYDAAWLELGASTEEHPQFRKALSHEQAIEMAANRIYSTAYQFLPEVILIVSGFFIGHDMLDVLRSRGHKIVILHTESPYEDGIQLERACRADISLVNDPYNLDQFRKASKLAEYVPHAYRPHLHHPGPLIPQLASDLALRRHRLRLPHRVLRGHGPRRARRVPRRQLDPAGRRQSPLNKHLAHDKGECLDNDQVVTVYNSAKARHQLLPARIRPRRHRRRHHRLGHGPPRSGNGRHRAVLPPRPAPRI